MCYAIPRPKQHTNHLRPSKTQATYQCTTHFQDPSNLPMHYALQDSSNLRMCYALQDSSSLPMLCPPKLEEFTIVYYTLKLPQLISKVIHPLKTEQLTNVLITSSMTRVAYQHATTKSCSLPHKCQTNAQ